MEVQGLRIFGEIGSQPKADLTGVMAEEEVQIVQYSTCKSSIKFLRKLSDLIENEVGKTSVC